MTVSNSKDTNQASELYELCKEVYERTGWKYTIGRFHDDGSYDGYVGRRGIAYMPSPQDSEWLPKEIPLYTSDYLLEKLEDVPVDYRLMDSPSIEIHFGGRKRRLAYKCRGYLGFDKDYTVYADTPLKALLKLTIALSEAGELK